MGPYTFLPFPPLSKKKKAWLCGYYEERDVVASQIDNSMRRNVILPSQMSFRTPTCCSLELFPKSRQQTHSRLSSHAASYMEILASQLCIISYWTAKRPCNQNCNITSLMFSWMHLRPRDWFTFLLFCNRVAVEISKAQSRGMQRQQQKVMGEKTHWSIKICWSWIETIFLKTKLALPRISHLELKQWSGKSSLKLNIKLKISKRVLLKLLLHKGSRNSILRSSNTSTVCRRFLKATRQGSRLLFVSWNSTSL